MILRQLQRQYDELLQQVGEEVPESLLLEWSNAKSVLAKNEELLETVNDQIGDKKDQLDDVNAKLENTHSLMEVIALKATAKILKGELSSLDSRKNEYETAISNTQKTLKSLTDQIDNLKDDLRQNLEDVNEKLLASQGKLSGYQHEANIVYGEYSKLVEAKADKEVELNKAEALKGETWDKYLEASKAEWSANWDFRIAHQRYQNIKYKRNNWLSLKDLQKDEYLMVDTAYMAETAGNKYQKFKMAEFKDFKAINGQVQNARDINGRFNYSFYYYPTVDSLVITADGGNDKFETVELWKDRMDWQLDPHFGNIVKLAVLTDKHQEVTIGKPEWIKGVRGDLKYTLNTRIGLNLVSATPGKDIPAGVYFADIVKDKDNLDAISRLMLDLDGEFTKVATAEWNVMKFEDMPAAKWVVKENTIYNGSPAVMNQESAELLNRGAYRIQDVKEDGTVILFMSWYNYQGLREDATIKLTLVPELNQLGYINKGFSVNTDSLFSLNYLNVAGNVSVQIGTENDTILHVANGEGTKFILENATKDAEKYGVDNAFLKRAYYIRVNDANKLNNNYKYVTVSDVDGTELMVVSGKENRAPFYLKEVNHADGTHYFALISDDKKAGVIDASGLIKAEDITGETRTSAFALNFDKTAYYRLFTAEELGENGVLNFYRTNTAEKAYLYEKDNLLEVENKGDNVGDLADLNVIPAVKEGIMPQYFIAKNVKVVEADTILCTENHASVEEALGCEHTKYVKDTIYGDFMVNFKIDADLDKANLWENKYSRLGFLNGYITNGKLYINEDSVSVTENVHNATKFSFRLVDEEDAKDFLIESESWGDKTAFDGGIRPFGKGGWIKVQNTVPVIVKTDYEDAIASADLFNVDTNAGGATANDEITTSEITVIAGEGNVTIANAAGKKVVVSNILGQIVATQVLTSDNAVIAAPQGVIVVAVEGEEAVRAIVK